MMLRATCLFVAAVWLAPSASASTDDDLQGTFIQVEGAVRVLPRPGKKDRLAGNAELNRYYKGGKAADVGMVVENGAVIVTRENAHARIVFPNGDQLAIGPKTVFRTAWRTKKPTVIDLVRGTLKAWITHGGPRSDLRVHSGTTVLGVRGTEFVVKQDPKGASTALSVLRGKVGLKSAGSGTSGVEIGRGQTAVVKEQAAAREVVVTTTTADELRSLEGQVAARKSEPARTLTPEVAKRVAALEAAASAAVVRDIEASEPELLASMKDKAKSKDLAEVLAAEEAAREHHAPSQPTKVEPPAITMEDAPEEEEEPASPKETPEEKHWELFAAMGPVASDRTRTAIGSIGFDHVGTGIGGHLEIGNAVGNQLVPAGPAGQKTVSLHFFVESALAWRPFSGETFATQLTVGGGYANYNQVTSAGPEIGYENEKGNNYNAAMISASVSERMALSESFGLLAAFSERILAPTNVGASTFPVVQLGVFYVP